MLLTLYVLAFGTSAHADDYAGALRYLSVTLRERIPTPEEARELHAAADKTALLDDMVARWLDSPEHAARVARHFNDMFGVSPFVFLADAAFDMERYDGTGTAKPDDLATPGVWHLPKTVKATCGTPTVANAWWSDTPITICSTALSSVVSPAGRYCPDPFGSNGIRHAACGCGPEQVLCFPAQLKKRSHAAVGREFPDRALHAYEQGLSWSETFGGGKLYGDRFLYHWYLYTERVAAKNEAPNAAEMALLKAMPLSGKTLVTLPSSGGPERGGVATMPAFMNRFNNFRSRVRALTEQLLCQDVEPTLNTSGISVLVNDDLSDFDKEHGTKENCAGCHYALDNFGSTLLGWNDRGFFDWGIPRSQAGHVFGEDGSGPRFLLEGYVERAPGFLPCMAKKTWEGFSGLAWEILPEADRTSFMQVAPQGPRALIRAVLTSPTLRDLRITKTTTVTTTAPVKYDWEKDVRPIVAKSCADAACHAVGNPRGPASAYAEGEARFKTAEKARIQNGSMPPPGSGYSLSDAEKNLLLIYLSQ